MLVQFVVMRDYTAYDAHIEKDPHKPEVPYGHIHDRIHNDGVDEPVFDALEGCLNNWCSGSNDESPPVLITLPDELSFHMSLMGVQPMNYLVYDIESGCVAFSDRMKEAVYEIRNKNRGSGPHRGVSGRGIRGSNNPQAVTPFFDFSIKDPLADVEPFIFFIDDREMVNDIAAVLMPYLKHRLKTNFIAMVDTIHRDVIEDYIYDNAIPSGMTMESYYFREDPLMKYDAKRRGTCFFSEHEVELFMHVLRECNSLYMEIRKEHPRVHKNLDRLFELLKFELHHEVARY